MCVCVCVCVFAVNCWGFFTFSIIIFFFYTNNIWNTETKSSHIFKYAHVIN